MDFWRLEYNGRGGFSLYPDPMGEFEANAALGLCFVVCLVALISPVLINPIAFLPALACFLLALVFRFFFCGRDNLNFLCTLYLPFASYAFVYFSETAIVNEEGEMMLVALPVILLAAIGFGLLSSKLMADDPEIPSEFSLAMVVLFGLTLGVAAPVAGLGTGSGVVVRYSLLLIYFLTAILFIRALIIFIKQVVKGDFSFGRLFECMIMFAAGCGLYLVMCLLGALPFIREISGGLCIILMIAATVIYMKVWKNLRKNKEADNTSLRFILLPVFLVLITKCFSGVQFTVRDDLIYPLSVALSRHNGILGISNMFNNVMESFSILFSGFVELIVRGIEEVFNCSIRSVRIPELAASFLGVIVMAVAVTITRSSIERAARRRAYRQQHSKK